MNPCASREGHGNDIDSFCRKGRGQKHRGGRQKVTDPCNGWGPYAVNRSNIVKSNHRPTLCSFLWGTLCCTVDWFFRLHSTVLWQTSSRGLDRETLFSQPLKGWVEREKLKESEKNAEVCFLCVYHI